MRSLLLAGFAALLARAPAADAMTCGPPPACAAAAGGAAAQLWAYCDLPPGDERSHELSAIIWDASARVLIAASDRRPHLVELRPDRDFRTFTFGATLPLSGRTRLRDVEGLALTRDGFLVADEQLSAIFHVTRRGVVGRALPLPPRFSRTRWNKGLEALGTTPDRRLVVFATEQALPGDGPESGQEVGTTVRLGLHDLATGRTREVAYRSDTLPGDRGDLGISEVTPRSPRDVLVTERAYVPGVGNRVRLYRVDPGRGAEVGGRATLGPGTPVLEKTLLLDLETLSECGLPEPPGPQPHRLLANVEGAAFGPRLPDGRQLLFLIADDNGNADQVARLYVLALREP
jgi:hypothetical protein